MTAVTSVALGTADVVYTRDVVGLVDVSGTMDTMVVVVDRRLVQLTVKGTETLPAVLAWKVHVKNIVNLFTKTIGP